MGNPRQGTFMFESRKELMAYLAGFLDGEGSFIIIFDCNGVFSGRINAGQVDRRPLELLVATFGGRIRKITKSYVSKFGNQMVTQWDITGPSMYKMLLEIQPYLLVKAEQADCLISLQESINMYKGRIGKNREFPLLPDEVISYRRELYEKCKALKRGLAATTKREGYSLAGNTCDSLDCTNGKCAEVAEMTTRLMAVRS